MIRGYIRLSKHKEETDSGLGIEAQEAAIARWADPLEALLYYDLDVSGDTPLDERPAFVTLLGELAEGDVVVVAKRDRLARNVEHSLYAQRLFMSSGVRLVSAAGEASEDESPMGKLMRLLLDGFAEFEREVIRARTKAALAVKRSRGERLGPVPFWERPEGATAAERIRELRKTMSSTRAMARVDRKSVV